MLSAADMHKVLVLPKLNTKEHVFVSRLVIFNETFASLNPNQPDFAVLRHEAISGRNAEDVASSYLKIIERCDFLINKFSVQNEKLKVRGHLRGIPEKKRDGILGVPQSKHLFWQSLPINNDSVDLGENLID